MPSEWKKIDSNCVTNGQMHYHAQFDHYSDAQKWYLDNGWRISWKQCHEYSIPPMKGNPYTDWLDE